MYLKIFIICLVFITVSCLNTHKPISKKENTIISGIFFRDIKYLPKTGKLYLYKTGTSFNDLILIRDSLKPFVFEKEVVGIRLGGNFNFSLIYDYRFIIDDTLCFDISSYETIPDTMGRTMRGWVIKAKLLSFRCNDSIITTPNDIFDPSFESRRIIKKGQYDQ